MKHVYGKPSRKLYSLMFGLRLFHLINLIGQRTKYLSCCFRKITWLELYAQSIVFILMFLLYTVRVDTRSSRDDVTHSLCIRIVSSGSCCHR